MRILCEGPIHLQMVSREIIEGTGEGVILRRVGSYYQHGRSESLVKIKSFHGDKEGIVIGLPTDKKGGVTLKLPNGTTFTVPAQDVHVCNLALGDIVSFSFDGHARREVPVNPKIFKIRSDLQWSHVVASARSEQYTTRPVSFWTIKKIRALFEDIAKKNNQDPLTPETWYNAYKSIKETAHSAIRKFKGGYFAMLQKVFPEIEFDYSAFSQSLWKDVSKRRKFFEYYAKQNNFNPRNPESWLSQSVKQILGIKGAKGITSYYGNSVHKALLHLFPDIGLDRVDNVNEKKYFENYAKDMKFDPLSADCWHQQPRSELVDRMGINLIVTRHGGIAKTLLHLFPDIGLEKLKFQFSYWSQIGNRKKFFLDFAKENDFDPLVPHCWYKAMPKLLSTKDVDKVVIYYNNLPQSLVDIFPNISFDKLLLRKNYAVAKRRKFFENYAKEHSFDALNPEHWYSHSRDSLLSTKGISKVISHYDNSVSKSLAELFSETSFNPLSYDIPRWRRASDRRNFFIQYAEEIGFDPYSANNWYLGPIDEIFSTQDAKEVLAYHNSDIRLALINLFPEIGFQKDYFDPLVYWAQASNRREILVNYARECGFDPNNPENWYSQPISAIMATKHAQKLVQYYQNVPKALVELFPEIGIDKRKLKMKFYSSSDRLNKRKFFETYAKRNHFDPLDPEQWYHRTTDIMSAKGAKMVTYFYKNSVAKALLDVFPNIGIKRDKFV